MILLNLTAHSEKRKLHSSIHLNLLIFRNEKPEIKTEWKN